MQCLAHGRSTIILYYPYLYIVPENIDGHLECARYQEEGLRFKDD